MLSGCAYVGCAEFDPIIVGGEVCSFGSGDLGTR